NASAAELLGKDSGELAERPLDALLCGFDLDRGLLAAMLTDVVAGRRRRASVEGRREGPEGNVLSLTLTPAGEVGGRAQALLLLDDVTERRRLDTEQQRLRDLLGTAASEWRATFDAIDVSIFILGQGHRVERLNRAARALVGREFAQILGHHLAEIDAGPLWQQAGGLVERVAAEGRPASREVRDGPSGRTWTLAASPGLPDLSAARPIILTVRELTGLVRLQESLRRNQTMAAMGVLVAGVAHEVRNPLFGISAVVDALERRIEERPELVIHLAYLRREVGRLEKLMADLLDFGRPVVPEPEPMPLDRVVDDALLACGAQIARAAVEIELHVEEEPPPVPLDRRRVTQALVNLIENALHHAPPGGELEIAIAQVERGGRRWSEVTVRDNGPGFRPGDMPRLFEPFYSRREGGTGLGLPIVVKIVEGHGGEVEAENAADGGAVVRLRFPLAAAAPAETGAR
ncbi:MAG TPA: ATP-binding protein, partial [Thermoanaerobaculia bacterium]